MACDMYNVSIKNEHNTRKKRNNYRKKKERTDVDDSERLRLNINCELCKKEKRNVVSYLVLLLYFSLFSLTSFLALIASYFRLLLYQSRYGKTMHGEAMATNMAQSSE